MRHDWILDVLADLRVFAKQNGMEATADHLADACLIVATEITNGGQDVKTDRAGVHDGEFGNVSGGYPAR
ncbi:hypothetical protein [Celeribacter arenosi]|uniref:Uncharacterized protein n=1 Tax=Celeribacter arenosi TaxID=792649 RepID=A0ABP7K3P5_9RHOB